MKIKKGVFILVLLVALLFLASCLNYKAYYQPSNESLAAGNEKENEEDLLSEIAAIEKELQTAEENAAGEAPAEEAAAESPQEEVPSAEEPPEEIPEASGEVTIPLKEEVDRSQLPKIEVKENELVSLRVRIDDPDKDKVTYTFSQPLNEQGKWKTNYGDAGEYVVTVSADDGTHTAKKDVLLVVQRVNVPPIIKKLENKFIKEGETISLQPQVADPNDDPVTVTISGPLSSGSWTTDHTSAGEYDITVTASDGELKSQQLFRLTVQNVNVPPVIADLPEELTVKEGEKVELKPVVTDLDNDKVTVTISNPIGNDGLWETTYTDHGQYSITVTVTDGKDTITKSLKLTVEDVNMPPVIGDITLG